MPTTDPGEPAASPVAPQSDCIAHQATIVAQAARIAELEREREWQPMSTAPRTFPMNCDLCGQNMESTDDYEWHGVGDCVTLCGGCDGSGQGDKFDALQSLVRELGDALQDARAFVRIYQMSNPKFPLKGETQDPLGVHAILGKVDSLLAKLPPAATPAMEGNNFISIWRFYDAPKELKELSTNGGDEDWIAVLPPSMADDCIPWLDEGSQFGCCTVQRESLSDGSVALIGCHA